jgi:hypothetical protein
LLVKIDGDSATTPMEVSTKAHGEVFSPSTTIMDKEGNERMCVSASTALKMFESTAHGTNVKFIASDSTTGSIDVYNIGDGVVDCSNANGKGSGRSSASWNSNNIDFGNFKLIPNRECTSSTYDAMETLSATTTETNGNNNLGDRRRFLTEDDLFDAHQSLRDNVMDKIINGYSDDHGGGNDSINDFNDTSRKLQVNAPAPVPVSPTYYAVQRRDSNPKSQSCYAFVCPNGFVWKSNADSLYFEESTDRDVCCEQVDSNSQSCDVYSCPIGFSLKTNADSLYFEDSTDRDVCCEQVDSNSQSCYAFVCPNGFVWKSNADSLYFEESTDRDVCCEQVDSNSQSCDVYSCPIGFSLKTNADSFYFEDSTDRDVCCEQVDSNSQSCDVYSCPIGFSLKTNADSLYFEDSSSFDVCCGQLGSCDVYSCPTGFALKTNAGSLYLAYFEDSSDKDVCCEQLGSCDVYSCPIGFALKTNADSLSFEDSSSFDVCCVQL